MILLTGAAGIIGSLIRPLLAASYEHVVLTDLDDIDALRENESYWRGDITDLDFVTRICQGVDGIVHLAGRVGPDFSFNEVLTANVIGTHNLFAAARVNRVSRFIYASSHHAVGYWKRSDYIDETALPRPDSQYGMSKAVGESIASYYCDKYAIDVLTIRIGYAAEQVIDERRLHTWISPRDLVQLIDIGLTKPNLGFEIVYGVSDNPNPFFNNANAERLGYRPADRGVDHLIDENILQHIPDVTKIGDAVVGGPFAEAGFVGDPARILGRERKRS